MDSKNIKDYKIIDETTIDVIEMLNNTNPKAKDEFLGNEEIQVPNNHYGNLDIESVEQNIKVLNERLESGFDDGIENRIIERLMYENLHQNQFVKLCDAFNRGNKSEVLKAEHQKLNTCLYGSVDRGSFDSILGGQLNLIESKSLMDEDKEIYDELMQLLPEKTTDVSKVFEPSDELFERFGTICENYLHDILKYVPKKDHYSPEDVCAIANNIFSGVIPDSGWNAIVEADKTFASVSQEKRTFYIPGNRSKGEFCYKDVKGLMAHEIGVHVFRTLPFLKCKVKAFSLGTPGYIGFEEGLANAVQHVVTKEKKASGHMHYVSIGLAVFYNMGFRQIYEIQWRIQKLIGLANKKQCFDSVQRTFRGTGYLLNSKDLAYFVGYEKAWKYIERNIDNVSLTKDLFESGKIDVTDEFWAEASRIVKQWSNQ